MNRLRSQPIAEAIAHSMAIIPERMRPLVACDYFTDTDPIFAGLHSYGSALDGRGFDVTPHCCYPFHIDGPASRRRTTVVMQSLWRGPTTIVHELGHVLDWRLDFSHDAVPVTRYAERNRLEAFAEAFTAWILPDYPAERVDDATLDLFERLAA